VNQLNALRLVVAKNIEPTPRASRRCQLRHDGGRIGVVLISGCKCWDIVTELEKQARPDDTRFSVSVRLTGIGEQARANEVHRRREGSLYQ
jgi:hypothetical protein